MPLFAPDLTWGVCLGEQQEVSLTFMVLEDLFSASTKTGTRSHIQEPGEGDGSSCPPGVAISAGGHMTALAQRPGPEEQGLREQILVVVN